MDRWKNDDIKIRLEIDFHVVEAVRRRRLSYFGLACRMKPERIPARVLHGRIHGSIGQEADRERSGCICWRTARDVMSQSHLYKPADSHKTEKSGSKWYMGR
jgi:hypothetical protein